MLMNAIVGNDYFCPTASRFTFPFQPDKKRLIPVLRNIQPDTRILLFLTICNQKNIPHLLSCKGRHSPQAEVIPLAVKLKEGVRIELLQFLRRRCRHIDLSVGSHIAPLRPTVKPRCDATCCQNELITLQLDRASTFTAC